MQGTAYITSFWLGQTHILNLSMSLSQRNSLSHMRSRTPSRSGTSTPISVPSTIRLTRSSSNLHIRSSSPLPAVPHHLTGSPSNDVPSSASSIINFDMSDGILVPETDAEAEMDRDQVSALGQMNSVAGDEESKKNLRAQLRKTLNKKQSNSGTSSTLSLDGHTYTSTDVASRTRRKGRSTDIDEVSHTVGMYTMLSLSTKRFLNMCS